MKKALVVILLICVSIAGKIVLAQEEAASAPRQMPFKTIGASSAPASVPASVPASAPASAPLTLLPGSKVTTAPAAGAATAAPEVAKSTLTPVSATAAATAAKAPTDAASDLAASAETVTEETIAKELAGEGAKDAAATEKAPKTIEEGMVKKISLDLRGMDILDTIKFLSMKGNLNIVTSKNVAGRITLFLKDVSIADTLEVILLTNKLASVTKNNIITIMTEAEYGELYGEKFIDKRELKTLKLDYAKPSGVGVALESIKSTIGKIIMDDATGTMILIDTPDKIAEMEDMAHKLDRGLVEKNHRRKAGYLNFNTPR